MKHEKLRKEIATSCLDMNNRGINQGTSGNISARVPEGFLLTPSGITRLLEGLEASGLVERTACPSDLRVAYAQLTDKGRETLAEASCGHTSSIRTLFEEHLSPEEIEQLSEMLARLPGVDHGDDACTTLID